MMSRAAEAGTASEGCVGTGAPASAAVAATAAVADAGAPVEAPAGGAGAVAAPAALGVAVDLPPADHDDAPPEEERHDLQQGCGDEGPDIAPVGIDLGATFCSVAVFLNGRAEVVPCEPDGSPRSPSTVAFTEFERLSGRAAEAQAAKNPLNTVTDGVRLLGKRFSDPEVQDWKKVLWPGGQLVRGCSGEPRVRVVIGGRGFCLSGEVICAMLIERLLKIAERHVAKVLDKNDLSVKQVYVSVPGGVHNSVVAALRRVGAILGIRVRPVRDIKALGLHYMIASIRPKNAEAWDRRTHVSLHVDVGAQGFRVGYLLTDDFGSKGPLGEVRVFRAEGGCALHVTLTQHFIVEIQKDLGDSGSGSLDARALRLLRQHAANVLEEMSSTGGGAAVTVEIPCILSARPDYCFTRTLSKTFLQQFFAPHIKAVTTLVRKVLQTGRTQARLAEVADPVAEVVLTGGGGRLPGLKQAIQKVVQNHVEGFPRAGDGGGDRSSNISFLHYSSGDVLAQGCTHLGAMLLGRRELSDILVLGVAGVAINVRLPNSKKLIPLVSSSQTVPYEIQSWARGEEDHRPLAPALIFAVNSWEERTRAVVEVYEGPDSRLSNNRLLGRLVLDDLPPVKPGGTRGLHVSAEGCDDYNNLHDYCGACGAQSINVFCPESGRGVGLRRVCGMVNTTGSVQTHDWFRAEHGKLWKGLLPKMARRDERIRAARDYVSGVEDMMFSHLPEELSDLILSEYVGSVGEGAACSGLSDSDGVSEDQLEALRLGMQNLFGDDEYDENSDVASEPEDHGVNGADVEPQPPGGNHEGGDEQEVHNQHVGGETDIGE